MQVSASEDALRRTTLRLKAAEEASLGEKARADEAQVQPNKVKPWRSGTHFATFRNRDTNGTELFGLVAGIRFFPCEIGASTDDAQAEGCGGGVARGAGSR